MNRPKPLLLMIQDGWGVRKEREGNAVELGATPNWHRYWNEYPHTLLAASGEAVGLPEGTMGNSEVGHLNIGAGRVVYQDFTRINKAIRDGSFFDNPVIGGCLNRLARSGRALHLMGLCSDIGVHAHTDHLFALIESAKRAGVARVFIHALTDGRDSPPDSGRGYLELVQRKADASGIAAIATVQGRFYAMDRDKRWDRVQKGFEAIVCGRGVARASAAEAVERSYADGVTDEFIVPAVMQRDGKPVGPVEDGDGMIFFNFRADRAREITRAIALPDFAEFERCRVPKLSGYVCMTEYDETFGLPVAFPSEALANILGEVISKAGLTQLRIAETEKYAHVTFFFNGGEEKSIPGEERCLIPSPREVPTYDLKPEMSAYLVTEELLRRIASGAYDVIILNFANGDMVGHTGVLPAAIKAVEAVDQCIGRIVPAVLAQGGEVLLTADHGNCEEMLDAGGRPMTAHSTGPVHFICVSEQHRDAKLRPGGALCDIAPTMLEILGLPQPAEMSGRTLIQG